MSGCGGEATASLCGLLRGRHAAVLRPLLAGLPHASAGAAGTSKRAPYGCPGGSK